MSTPPIAHYHSTFPGEPYLNLPLPNYEWERHALVIKLIAATFIFFFWLPDKFVYRTVLVPSKEEIANGNINTVKHSNDGKNGISTKKKRRGKTTQPKPATPTEITEAVEIDPIKSSFLTILGILALFLILLTSPYNLYSRRILRAPLFTVDECRSLIQAAEEAAKRNEVEAKRRREEMLLEQPELLWEDGYKNGTNGEWKKVNSLLLGEF